MKKNNLEQQNYKKRKKNPDKVEDTRVSLPRRPTLSWSKLNRNAENIVPRFPKLQQRTSKLRIKGMTTILEESLAANPPKIPSNSSLTISNVSNTITDPSATSNDVDSLTLASNHEFSSYAQSFTVFPLSVPFSNFFLGNHSKSSRAIKKTLRKNKSSLSMSDSSTSVSVVERRPSILQCILSEVFNNGKNEEGVQKNEAEIKTKKNDEKKQKDDKTESKKVGDKKKLQEPKENKEGGDNGVVKKCKDEEKSKEVYENDMGRVEKEMRRREYEEVYRISREIQESREKEGRLSRESNMKRMEKYKSFRGRSKESKKSDGKMSRNKSKRVDKPNKEMERRHSTDRKGKNNEDKKNKKRLKIFQRKTKNKVRGKREDESEDRHQGKKLIFVEVNNDLEEKLDPNSDDDQQADKGAGEGTRRRDRDKKRSSVSKESKGHEIDKKHGSNDRRSVKSKYESDESEDENEVRNKSKRKEQTNERDEKKKKNREEENDGELKEKGNRKQVKDTKTEKVDENDGKHGKKSSVTKKIDRKKVNLQDEERPKDSTEVRKEKEDRQVENRRNNDKEKHLEKKENKLKSVSKISKDDEKYKKNKEKKDDKKENAKQKTKIKDDKKATVESKKQKDMGCKKTECFRANENHFKFSDEMKNMMHKDIRGKRNNKSPKRLFVGDAGEGILDHKASHKPVEASKSEDTPSYDRDNSFIKIKKSLKQFAEYSKHKLEDKISSFSVNVNRNLYDSPGNARKHRFARKHDKFNITISRTSNMQKVLNQDEACYKNLYSCENSHQASKPKLTIKLEDLGSLEIPPFKPKSPQKQNIDDIQSDPPSGNSFISAYESTGLNSSAVASTSLMIISDFSETENSNASTKISFRSMLEELCSIPMVERFPNFPINPYCLMAFNNYKRKNINRGTNTEITWTRDELKFNLNSARGISKAKIKVPQYQIRKALMKNKTVKAKKQLGIQTTQERKSSRIPVIQREASPSSEASSKVDEKSHSKIPIRNPAIRSVSSPNNEIKHQEKEEIADKVKERKNFNVKSNQELKGPLVTNAVQKKKSHENIQIQEKQSDVSETVKDQFADEKSNVREDTHLVESISALEHVQNIEDEVYDFSDETEEISKKKKNKKSKWYSNLFSRSFGENKRIAEEMIEAVTEDVSDRKRFDSKIARPKTTRNVKEESTTIEKEELGAEEKKLIEQDAGGNLESLAAALKEKTRLSFEAELRKIEEDFIKYNMEKERNMKSNLIVVENLKSEEFIKEESLELQTNALDDMPRPAFQEQSGTIMAPKIPPRSPKNLPTTDKPIQTKQILPIFPTQIPRKVPPLPPKDFPECPNFINNETLLVNVMNEKTIGLLPSSVKLTSSVSLISIKEVNSKAHSVSLQVMVPSKAVETNTSKSLIVGKPTKKSKLPLRIKDKNEREKKRVDGVNSFTFPIEIDLKKAIAEAKSSGNVSGLYEASDNSSPLGQDLNFSSSSNVSSKFGSYLKKIKKFFVGKPDNSKVNVELEISEYESVCNIFDERLRLRQISSSESNLHYPNYFNQPVIAALATTPAITAPSEPLKNIPEKYKGLIPIDIEGFLYFVFTSLLRKYLEEEFALKALVPCTMGQQYKAPKLSDSILVDPNPVLDKVSSIECKYDEVEMKKPGFVKNITITVEDMEKDDDFKKLPPNVKRLKEIEIKNEYVFEIVYEDEPPELEDKEVQTDFEEEEIEEEEEEKVMSDKEVQTDIEEGEEEEDLVEVISIAIQTDDEDDIDVISASIQLDDGPAEKKEDEIGDGDKKLVTDEQLEEEEPEKLGESEFEKTTGDSSNILPKDLKDEEKVDKSDFEETTEDDPKDAKPKIIKKYISSDSLSGDSGGDSLTDKDLQTDKIEVESTSMETEQFDEKPDADKTDDDKTSKETKPTPRLKDISQETDRLELVDKSQETVKPDVVSRSQETDKRESDMPEIKPPYKETDNLDSLSKEEQLSKIEPQTSSETMLSKKKPARAKCILRRKQKKQKQPIENLPEPCICAKLTSSTETPPLPVRPNRSDDFTLVLEPTQEDVELIIGFKDNDFKLILPSNGSRISIFHEEQTDTVYDLLNVLFENLKQNKDFVRKMHKVLQNANKDIAKKLFNSKAVSRAKHFIRDILDSVIKMEGVCILDANKILEIEKEYRDICSASDKICQCAELKKTSYSSIFSVDNSSLKRCVCGNMKEHTKSCPCIPKENVPKKRKGVRKNSNTPNKEIIVLHAFEQRPTSDHVKEDEEKKESDINDIELERSYNSIMKDISKSTVEFIPFVEPVHVFRLKEDELNKNPPILWSLAKKFLRNRRNRNEERKRLASRRKGENAKNSNCSKGNCNSKRTSSSSSKTITEPSFSSSQAPSEESIGGFLYSQSEFLETCKSLSSVPDVLLRKLDGEEAERIEKKVEFLYPKNCSRKECPSSSRCFTSSNSSGFVWSLTNIETLVHKENEEQIKASEGVKKKVMDASTSDDKAHVGEDLSELQKEDFKMQESSKGKKNDTAPTEENVIITEMVEEQTSGDGAKDEKRTSKEEKINNKKSKKKNKSSISTEKDSVGTRDEYVEKEIQNTPETEVDKSPRPSSAPPITDKEELTRNNVVVETGTNTSHTPKKIKRRKSEKSDKETETEFRRKPIKMEVISEEDVKIIVVEEPEPKEDVEVIIVEEPEPKEDVVVKQPEPKDKGKQHCRLCEELDNAKNEKKSQKKKKLKKDNADYPDNIVLLVKEPEERDFQKGILYKPEDSVNNKNNNVVLEEQPVAGKPRSTLCDTLRKFTTKKSLDDKNDKPLLLLTGDMPLDKINKLLSKIFPPDNKPDLPKRMVPCSSESSLFKCPKTESLKKSNSASDVEAEKDKRKDTDKHVDSKHLLIDKIYKTNPPKKGFCEDNIFKSMFHWKKLKGSADVVNCGCKHDTATQAPSNPESSLTNKKQIKTLNAAPLSDSDESEKIPVAPSNTLSNLDQKQSVLKNPSLLAKLKLISTDVSKSDIYTETIDLEEDQKEVANELRSGNKPKSFVSTGSDPININQDSASPKKLSDVSIGSFEDTGSKIKEPPSLVVVSSKVKSGTGELGEQDKELFGSKDNSEQVESDRKALDKRIAEKPAEASKKKDVSIYSAYEVQNSSDESKKSKKGSKRNSDDIMKDKNASKTFEFLDSPTQTSEISIVSDEKDETGTQTSVNSFMVAKQADVVSAGINTKNTKLANTKVQTSESLLPAACPGTERTLKNLTSKNPQESLYLVRKVQDSKKTKPESHQIGNILCWSFLKNLKMKTSPENKDETTKNKKENTRKANGNSSINPPTNNYRGEKKVPKECQSSCRPIAKCKDNVSLTVSPKCKNEPVKCAKRELKPKDNAKDKSKPTSYVGAGDKGDHVNKPTSKEDKESSKSKEDKKNNNDSDLVILDGTRKQKYDPDPEVFEPYVSENLSESIDETIKLIQQRGPSDSFGYEEDWSKVNDPDPAYDQIIIIKKEPGKDDDILGEIDEPKTPKGKREKSEYNSIGVQVDLIRNLNCNCPAKTCTGLLSNTLPTGADGNYNVDTTDRTVLFPDEPNEDPPKVVPPRKIYGSLCIFDDPLPQNNETELNVVDFEKFCLCKNNSKENNLIEGSFKGSRERSVSLRNRPDVIPDDPYKYNKKISNAKAKENNLDIAKESKLKRGFRNFSNMATSKSAKFMSRMCPANGNNVKKLGLSPEDICRGQGNAEIINKSNATELHSAVSKRKTSSDTENEDYSTKINSKEIDKNISFGYHEHDGDDIEQSISIGQPAPNLENADKINDDLLYKSFVNVKDSLSLSARQYPNSNISKVKYEDEDEQRINDANVMQTYNILKSTIKTEGRPFSYDIVKYYRNSETSHNSECEEIFEEELHLIKEIQKRALYADKVNKNKYMPTSNLSEIELNAPETIRDYVQKYMAESASAAAKTNKTKSIMKFDEKDTPSVVKRKIRAYQIAEDLNFNDSGHEQLRCETIRNYQGRALAEILDFDEEEFNLEKAIKKRNKNIAKIDHRTRLKNAKGRFRRSSSSPKRFSVNIHEGWSQSEVSKSIVSKSIVDLDEDSKEEVEPADLKEIELANGEEEPINKGVEFEGVSEMSQSKSLDEKEGCNCCEFCRQPDCTCQYRTSTLICEIPNPNLFITCYHEYLSVDPDEEKFKTETVLNFDSEVSKGEESTKLSLLKDLLESNLVLSKQKPTKKISEIKVEVDEDICILNEDSIPHGSSTKDSARLSTIIEKSENETSQKKHAQKPANKPEIKEKQILELQQFVQDKNLETVKPKLLGLSKFLKKISKAVHRKKIQENLSVSTIFAPRNIIESLGSPVAEIEISGKKFLVHRSPNSPSGSTDGLNSQRTINSDIPSLKSYETPNGTGKPVTIIEDDLEEISQTNAEYSDDIYHVNKDFDDINALKELLKPSKPGKSSDKSCYRMEEGGKETLQEFWRREGFWKTSVSKEKEKRGVLEKLQGEWDINRKFANTLKREIIKNVFEMAANNSNTTTSDSSNLQNLSENVSKKSSSHSSLCVLQGKHQSGERLNHHSEKKSQKSSKDLNANSRFCSKEFSTLMTTDNRNVSRESKRFANASYSGFSRLAGVSRTSRNVDSNILGSYENDFSDEDMNVKATIVKDVIILPRSVPTSKEMKSNSSYDESVKSEESHDSHDSGGIISNSELVSLLESLGRLGRITEESSCCSENVLSEDSNENSNSRKECLRAPLILRSQNSDFLQSYEKLRPILLENISRESEHYVYKQICSYLDTSSCQQSSNSNSNSTETNGTSTKSQLNSSEQSSQPSQPSQPSHEESISRQSSLESYPSIRSRYRTHSNKTTESYDDELSRLLKKDEVVALMMQYRREQILEEARMNSQETNRNTEEEKKRKCKDNEDTKSNEGKRKNEKKKYEKVGGEMENNNEKINRNIEEMEKMFENEKMVKGFLEEKVGNDGFTREQRKTVLVDEQRMESEFNKVNTRRDVENSFNYQENSNFFKSKKKSVRFSENSERIIDSFDEENYGDVSGYSNTKNFKTNENFEQFADINQNRTVSEFTETDNAIVSNDLNSELLDYTSEKKYQNIPPAISAKDFTSRGSNKSVKFSNFAEEPEDKFSNFSEEPENNRSCNVNTLTATKAPSVISSNFSFSKEKLRHSRSQVSIKKIIEEHSNSKRTKMEETQTPEANINYSYRKNKFLEGLKKELFPICNIEGTVDNEGNGGNMIVSTTQLGKVGGAIPKPRETRMVKTVREKRDFDFKERFEREFIIGNSRNIKKKTFANNSKQILVPKFELTPILAIKQVKQISPPVHYNSDFSTSTTNYCGLDSTHDENRESKNPYTIFEKYRNKNFRSYSFLSSTTEEKTSIEDCDEYVLAVHNYTTTELLKKIGDKTRQSSKYIAAEKKSTVISFDENLRPIVSNEGRIDKMKLQKRVN